MPALYRLDEEKALAEAIDQVKTEAGAAVAKEDFAAAMTAMAKLRPAVDAFFDKVKVNDDDRGARKPPQAAQRNSRRDPRGRGFFEDPGLATTVIPGRAVARTSDVQLHIGGILEIRVWSFGPSRNDRLPLPQNQPVPPSAEKPRPAGETGRGLGVRE